MPTRHQSPVTLSPTQRAILAVVAQFGILTTSQVCAALARSPRWARKSLASIERMGLVHREPIPIHQSVGRPEVLSSITAAGRKALTESGELHQPLILRTSGDGILHHLACVDIAISLQGSARKHHIEITFEPRSTQGGNRSDLHFLLWREGRVARYLVEVDRGTEPLSSDHLPNTILGKLLAYTSHFDASCDSPSPVGPKGFRLLIITTTAGRVERIHQLAQDARLGDVAFIWLTTIQAEHVDYLTAPVWQRCNDPRGTTSTLVRGAKVGAKESAKSQLHKTHAEVLHEHEEQDGSAPSLPQSKGGES